VCGTDEHLLHGTFLAEFPLIPGHEMLGVVDALGDGVEGLAVGERVAVDNATACGVCRACRRGEPLFCANFASQGCNAPGGFAEYAVSRADCCYPVGDLPDTTAVLAEPLACVVHGADVLDLRPASDVLVFGAGPTGLLMAQLLLSSGAARVTMAAPTAAKLELARALGVQETVQIRRDDPVAAHTALRALAPDGFDAVVEATGAVAVFEQCAALARMGGTVLVYGLAPEDTLGKVSPYDIFRRELTFKGSFAQVNCFDRSILALRSGRVRGDGIVSGEVGLDGFGTALANLHDSGVVKTVVRP
jgi:D-arabinitol dehydrogenase (NADP+)